MAIDLALEDLEQLNLAGRVCVPEEVAGQMALLLRSVPPHLGLHVEHKSVELVMDDLYRAQRSLLIERTGPEWDELRAYEDELLPSA